MAKKMLKLSTARPVFCYSIILLAALAAVITMPAGGLAEAATSGLVEFSNTSTIFGMAYGKPNHTSGAE